MTRPLQPGPVSRLRCRQIEATDLPALATLLAEGFPRRSRDAWRRGLDRMAERDSPAGHPRFGFVLEVGGRLVGALLTIHAAVRSRGGGVRCNLSSWYVDPPFRPYAALLARRAMGRGDVTYTDISPAADTLATIAALGFERYGADRIFSVPALLPPYGRRRIDVVGAGGPDPSVAGSGEDDIAALRTAARHGCLAVLAHGPDGVRPFAFLPTVVKGVVPAALLVQAPSMEAFTAAAGPLGRFLARRGMPVVLVDGDAPVPRLPGLRRVGTLPKYCRGPAIPDPWDLAETEWTVFGA